MALFKPILQDIYSEIINFLTQTDLLGSPATILSSLRSIAYQKSGILASRRKARNEANEALVTAKRTFSMEATRAISFHP